MMVRSLVLIVAGTIGLLLVPTWGIAQSSAYKLGKPFEGELKGRETTPYVVTGGLAGLGALNNLPGFGERIPVDLQGKQSVTFTAKVDGDNRKVFLLLIDPFKKEVARTLFQGDTAELEIKAVSVTGRFTLVLFSDRAGGFTLTGIDPKAPTAPTVESLEGEIKELKQKLTEKEKQLADLKAKAGIKDNRDR